MIRIKNFRLLLVVLFTEIVTSTSANEVLSLNSYDGTKWQVFPAANLMWGKIVRADFQPDDYVEGIVPGTIFSAYVAAGREEDPNWGDNIYRVDESKYNQTFWYRTKFTRPELAEGQHAILVFEGTNRYATVYLNGRLLNRSRIKGHVMKVRYDITSYLQDDNILAVKIEMPAANHIARSDNFVNYVVPTYVASHSWDWMPYVPGLNCGITNDVYIEKAGEVTLRDPWVRTASLTDNNQAASLSLQTSLMNLTQDDATVELRATVMPGNITTTKAVTIHAGDSIDVSFNNVDVKNPLLWWPNGTGSPNLYTCLFEVVKDGQTIDTQNVTFGIRKYEYRKENTTMVVYVNGKKVYCKGGNWGMSDYLLRVHGKDYDTRIRLHKDMHFNMIRLWTGCVTDEEFYEACDRYGIMIWDDFWLTGPYTGLTGPDDRKEFVANARDKVIRMRNHPSLAIWCGCNEGWPYDELNQDIIDLIKTYDADDRVYIPNSHNGYASYRKYEARDGSGLGLSGSGWWKNFPPEEYFATGIWGGGGDQGDKVDWGFRSELGMGAFTTFESFKEFMPEEYWWPRNEMWEKHFFSDEAAYGGAAGATGYFDTVNKNYGTSRSAEEFCEKAQFMNIEVMKALYEGWQDNLWNTASGLLFWMSQPAYPCFIWQTYDYYYDATGTYWGAKKACEPLHIQWNCSNDKINVVNTTPQSAANLSASVEVYRLNGTLYEPCSTEVSNISVPANSVKNIYTLPTTEKTKINGMYFIRLKLYDESQQLVSENFYWKTTRGNKDVYTDLNRLARANVSAQILSQKSEGSLHTLKVNVTNQSTSVAFGIRIRLVDANTGKRILPIILEDNYFTLFGGESRELNIEYDETFNPGVQPKILLKQYRYAETEQDIADGIILDDGLRIKDESNNPSSLISHPSSIYDLQGKPVDVNPLNLPGGVYVSETTGKRQPKRTKFIIKK